MALSILGVMLAGGKARRMGGRAKGLVPYNQRPLCEPALIALSEVCDQVMINTNDAFSGYESLGYSIFIDKEDHIYSGPLSGVYSALVIAEEQNKSHLLISPCDTPNVPNAVFKSLKEKATKNPEKLFYMETESGTQPLHAIIPVAGTLSVLNKFLQQQNNKVLDFYSLCNATALMWESEEDFANINYLEQI